MNLKVTDVLRVMLENPTQIFEIRLFLAGTDNQLAPATSYTLARNSKIRVEGFDGGYFNLVETLKSEGNFELIAYIKSQGKVIAYRERFNSPLLAVDETLFENSPYDQLIEDDLYRTASGRSVDVSLLSEASAGDILSAFFKHRQAEKEKANAEN